MSTGVSTAPLAALLLAAACLVTAPGPAHRLGARARGPRNPVWIPVGGCAVVLAALTVGRAGVVVAGGIAGATVVHVFSARRAAKEDTARTRHAATFIGHLAEGVGAGSTLADAAARAAEHIPPDAPEVLRRDVAQFVGAAQRGCTPPELATPELARVAALWELSTSRGVPVARLLAAARTTSTMRSATARRRTRPLPARKLRLWSWRCCRSPGSAWGARWARTPSVCSPRPVSAPCC
ncbi:hypothetical protein JKI95_05835 [Corynebacterium aquatimens]|uniref:hypothetical protein n=1 Tax=Corynebacterium aquatimens TaxID=1190508 RepID=UPI002540595B|nr:hypothetical protein [Corynebacterium aquatimens]QYH20377.1 hypothetical protein JKI95_05835 [Corynebacterium aquatimens]